MPYGVLMSLCLRNKRIDYLNSLVCLKPQCDIWKLMRKFQLCTEICSSDYRIILLRNISWNISLKNTYPSCHETPDTQKRLCFAVGDCFSVTKLCWYKNFLKYPHRMTKMMQPSHFPLTHWDRDKIDAISQTTFSSAFSWMKMFEFRLKFHWSLFLRVQLTTFQHWSR